MSSVYHLSVCLPYDTKNPIERISEDKGFRFVNLPGPLNGDREYEHIKKLIWCRDFISENLSIHDSIVMFTDAHDVLILSDASDICGRFFRADCDLFFSAEKVFSPWMPDEKPYRTAVREYFETDNGEGAPYPNSGCWIGYGWAALAFLKVAAASAKRRKDKDDQRMVQDILAQGKCPENVRVKIDNNQNIFVSVVKNGNDLYWVGNKVFYKKRNDSIPVFHANGYKKAIYFIDFYTKIFYGAKINNLSVKAIKNREKYICVNDNVLFMSDSFCEYSLNVLIKANRFCCLVDNNGNVVRVDGKTRQINSGDLVSDDQERLEVSRMDEEFQCFFDDGEVHISFEDHILNHTWWYFSENMSERLLRFYYNL